MSSCGRTDSPRRTVEVHRRGVDVASLSPRSQRPRNGIGSRPARKSSRQTQVPLRSSCLNKSSVLLRRAPETEISRRGDPAKHTCRDGWCYGGGSNRTTTKTRTTERGESADEKSEPTG